jgi:hypothetical protein
MINQGELNDKYQLILKESQEDDQILGLFFGGARGKSEEFLTENSDMDIYVIISDNADEELIEKINNLQATEKFDLNVLKISEFIHYADWGTEKDWNRYNFTHNKAIIDKTGEIQKLMDEKGKLPNEVQRRVIEDLLDNYINSLYRSVKYFRDGNNLSAYIDATETLPNLMTALYALEGRIKPYNKYFKWELENFPLKFLPWPVEEFIADYKHILETGDIETQKKIYKEIKRIFTERGYQKPFEEWRNYYFVGE